ncbi:Ribosomal L1 domain-containing protein 1 [Podochytrium sp. JEL0797]|nr:Ribosomal L1 domain-containing protein 1 [Podochytrium sp. JEL0797]
MAKQTPKKVAAPKLASKAAVSATTPKKAVVAKAVAAVVAQDPPSKVPRTQIEKAVKALVAFSEKKAASKAPAKAADLLAGDDEMDLDVDPSNGQNFWLVIATKKMPSVLKIKPVKIPVKHSFAPSDAEICLFTKDPQREFKDLLEAKGITSITKVIGVSKLKADYYSFEAKRQLCESFDLFLTDDRIIPLLPPLLGKTFFEKKRHPVPVSLKSKKIEAEIAKAISGTFLHLNKGLCNSVKIGTTFQTQNEVVENILYSLENIASKIPGHWKNIQSIHVKLSDSVSLPLYNSLPEADIALEEPKPKKEKKVDAKADAAVEAAPAASPKKVAAPTPVAIKNVKAGRVEKKKTTKK